MKMYIFIFITILAIFSFGHSLYKTIKIKGYVYDRTFVYIPPIKLKAGKIYCIHVPAYEPLGMMQFGTFCDDFNDGHYEYKTLPLLCQKKVPRL